MCEALLAVMPQVRAFMPQPTEAGSVWRNQCVSAVKGV